MLLPLLIAFVVSVGAFNSLLDFVDEMVHESTAELLPVVALQADIQQIITTLHDRSSSTFADKKLEEFVSRIEASFQTLRVDGEIEDVRELNALDEAYRLWSEQYQDLTRISGGLAAAEEMELVRIDRAMRQVLRKLDALVYASGQEMHEMLEEAGNTRDRAGLMIGLTLLLALVMASIFGHILAQSILRPLAKLREGADHFGKGDFTYRVSVQGSDELSRVAYAFNRMAVRLDRSLRSLRRLSTRDYLTSLLNAREFYRLLDAEVERSQRYGLKFSLILVDADHFKQVNDTHGHQSGDRVLRELARALLGQVRAVDIPARVGGEEFAVILPNTIGEAALAIAERFRKTIEETPLSLDDASVSELRMTVSVGLATFPQSARDSKELFHQADMALYRAKQGGRNRVCIA